MKHQFLQTISQLSINSKKKNTHVINACIEVLNLILMIHSSSTTILPILSSKDIYYYLNVSKLDKVKYHSKLMLNKTLKFFYKNLLEISRLSGNDPRGWISSRYHWENLVTRVLSYMIGKRQEGVDRLQEGRNRTFSLPHPLSFLLFSSLLPLQIRPWT